MSKSTLQRRARQRNDNAVGSGPVVYWMQRDQRAEDNWALLYAQAEANQLDVPLWVVFNLVPQYGQASYRQYHFMVAGLKEVQADLARRNIPFILLTGQPADTISSFVDTHQVGQVVTDFNPLRFTATWRRDVAEALSVCLTEVDARNIIPCWEASDKEEFAAHTFRPKVHRLLDTYLTDFPALHTQADTGDIEVSEIDWDDVLSKEVDADKAVSTVDWLTPGTQAAKLRLNEFIDKQLPTYHTNRNDPVLNAVSHLSPYLHFGQLSSQYVARKVKAATAPKDAKDAFLEELIVRRELTDNFCFYNREYDKVSGAHEWAQKTIAEHEGDEREYVYSRDEFEAGETHDELWNAMQTQMVTEGKMHGWCRMYWAKKILEWTPDAQTAVDTALYLNDKYELDGNDPNGVVGVMWSICGVHDRAWTERPVFGKIRYMNFNGAKRKFDVKAYIARYTNAPKLID